MKRKIGCAVEKIRATQGIAWWWIAVPDHSRAPQAVHSLLAGTQATNLARHPSQRPWVIGDWPGRRLLVVSAGNDTAAIFTGKVLSASLQSKIKCALSYGHVLDWLAAESGIEYVLVSRSSGSMEVYAPAATPLVWMASHNGLVVLSSHARALAPSASVDDAWCAGQLLSPTAPWPLARRAPFTGVTAVTNGQVARVSGGKCVEFRRWLSTPDRRSVNEASKQLYDGLRSEIEAQSDRGRGALVVAAGDLAAYALMDVAAQLPDLVIRTVPRHLSMQDRTAAAAGAPQFRDDRPYDEFRQALALGADWHILPALDVPPSWGLSIAAMRASARQASTWGSDALISSYGSDAILRAPLAYLHRVLDQRSEYEHMLGWASVFHIPVDKWHAPMVMRHILAMGAIQESYSDWIAGLAKTLAHPFEPWMTTGWEPRPALPSWATRRAHELAADLLLTSAGDAQPLAGDMVEHATHAAIRTAGLNASLERDAALAVAGIPIIYPYLSANAMAACLSALPEERSIPGEIPLLQAGLGAATHMGRVHARHSYRHLDQGLLHNRAGLRDLLCGGSLADRGLINSDTINKTLDSVAVNPSVVPLLNNTLVTEQWLQSKG